MVWLFCINLEVKKSNDWEISVRGQEEMSLEGIKEGWQVKIGPHSSK